MLLEPSRHPATIAATTAEAAEATATATEKETIGNSASSSI